MNPSANATVDYVKKIPVVIPQEDLLNEINKITKNIIEIKRNNNLSDIDDLKLEIDNIFYNIYNLSTSEKAIINEFNYHIR